MNKSFADLRKNNAIVAHILDVGGTPEDCCIGLAEALEYATNQCMKYIAIAPRKIRMPNGTIKVWRCPDELIPFIEPIIGMDDQLEKKP